MFGQHGVLLANKSILILLELASKQNVAPIYGLNYKDDAAQSKIVLKRDFGNPFEANASDEAR